MTEQDLSENDFLALFKKNVEVSDEPLKVPEKIKFTKGALDKAFAIGKIIDEITFGNYEWHGFMLAKKDDPSYIVRDIFIAKGAEIAPGRTNLDAQALTNAAEGVAEMNKEKGTDYNIIGVIHSHGSDPVGHSRLDDEAFVHVINSYCGATQQYFRRPVQLIEGQKESIVEDGKVVLKGSNLEDAVLRFHPPTEEELKEILTSEGIIIPEKIKDIRQVALEVLLQSEMGVEQTVSAGFAYSVVVNLKKETYAEVGLREFGITTGQERIRAIKDVDVETVKVEDDVTYDENNLRDEATIKFKFGTNGGSLKWKVGNLVRVYSAKDQGYIWKKEQPRKTWTKKPGQLRQGQHPEKGMIARAIDSLFMPPRMDGWDGESVHGQDPETGQQWYSGSPPAQSYVQQQYPSQPYQNFAQPQPEIVEKLNDPEGICIDDIAFQFLYSALGYVSRFRHKECQYSQYMASVLGTLSLYSQQSDNDDVRTSFRKAYDVSGGIKVDEERVVKPDLKPSVYTIHRKISNNASQDTEQLEFMILFSEAQNIGRQNDLIREYALKFAGATSESETPGGTADDS